MKFRKKPVVIDAIRFETMNDDARVVWGWIAPDGGVRATAGSPPGVNVFGCRRAPVIKTLEGWHEVTFGDWIITGIKGEAYPCKPDIFAATYEPV